MPITHTMKYILIGLGSLVGVSALVWIATQSSSPALDHVLVGQEPEMTVKEQVPQLDTTSTAHAHSSTKKLPGDPLVASDNPADDAVPGSAGLMVKLASNVAMSVSKRRTAPTHCDDSVKGPCDHLQAFRDEPAAEERADHKSDGVHVSSMKALNIGAPRKQPSVASKTGGRLSRETPEDKSIAGAMLTAARENSLNEEDFGNRAISREISGSRTEEFFGEPIVPIEASEEELVAVELIALPTSPNAMPEEAQGNLLNDPIAQSIEEESVNTKPRIMASNEPSVEQATPETRQVMTKSSDDEGGYRLEVLGIRGGFNAKYVAIPPTEKEDFEHFDVFGAISFPKRYDYDSGWEIRFRMNGSMGILRSGSDLGFIATVSPGIVFWYPEWSISINGGPGFAYVSREKYGDQDLGGPIQIVGHGGLTYYVTDHIGIGWRFHHLSDAGIWGSDNRGVDVNMFELTYKF